MFYIPIYKLKVLYDFLLCDGHYIIIPSSSHNAARCFVSIGTNCTDCAAERETTIFLHGPVVKSRRARILGVVIDYTRIVQDRGGKRNL